MRYFDFDFYCFFEFLDLILFLIDFAIPFIGNSRSNCLFSQWKFVELCLNFCCYVFLIRFLFWPRLQIEIMHLLLQLLVCINCLLLILTAVFMTIVVIIVFSDRNELDWLASPSTRNYPGCLHSAGLVIGLIVLFTQWKFFELCLNFCCYVF